MSTVYGNLVWGLILLAAWAPDDFKPDVSGIVIDETIIDKLKEKELAQKLLPIMKEHRETAIKIIHQNLGFKAPFKVKVQFADSIQNNPDTVGLTRFYGDKVTIYFALQTYATKKLKVEDLKATFTHELIHAYLASLHTQQVYKAFPVWMHEGIAVYGSNQMADRAKFYLRKKKPEEIVDGLEDKDHNFFDYVEDALSYEYVRVKHGPDKVKQIAGGLEKGGIDYKVLIKNATGEDFAAFDENTKKFALDYLRKLK